MPKLYSNAVILGYRRTKSVQQEGTSLLKIEGVKSRQDTDVCRRLSELCSIVTYQPR
jgi:ribosomal protein L35AE/L33A